ncbi:hypothetical protein J2W42_000820 [Rhizobium tibeticum]|nr:hypothetical protein [Rhizobium tibeticum]
MWLVLDMIEATLSVPSTGTCLEATATAAARAT